MAEVGRPTDYFNDVSCTTNDGHEIHLYTNDKGAYYTVDGGFAYLQGYTMVDVGGGYIEWDDIQEAARNG